MKILLTLALLFATLALTTPVEASAMRIDIDASNASTATFDFELEVEAYDNYFTATLVLPQDQEALEHLYSIEVWYHDEAGSTLLTVPLDMELDDSMILQGDFMFDSDLLERVAIVIRVGVYAPLSETMYQIDVGSFGP